MDKAFAVSLALYLILLVTWPHSGIQAVVTLAVYVLGAWIALRLLRLGLRKITWRLRNRLIVAYLFIAVLPILLVLTLVGLGAYMLAGQVAVYLARSELDRRVVSLRSVAADVSASPLALQRIDETEQQRFPGLILLAIQSGAEKEWPPDRECELARGVSREFQRIRTARRTLLRLGGHGYRRSSGSGVNAADASLSERVGARVWATSILFSGNLSNPLTKTSSRTSPKRPAAASPRLARAIKRSFDCRPPVATPLRPRCLRR